jgi:phosphinothricin acetyltransferase
MLEIYRPYIDTPITFEVTPPTLDDFENRVRETLKKFPWLVCEVDGRVAGYSYASPYRSRCAYEWSVESTVYVHQDFHGRGVGRQLYTKLLELLKAQGAVNVIAGITLPNDASVGIHESFGFQPAGVMKDVGFKLGRWWDVGFWQLQLQKPDRPEGLRTYPGR